MNIIIISALIVTAVLILFFIKRKLRKDIYSQSNNILDNNLNKDIGTKLDLESKEDIIEHSQNPLNPLTAPMVYRVKNLPENWGKPSTGKIEPLWDFKKDFDKKGNYISKPYKPPTEINSANFYMFNLDENSELVSVNSIKKNDLIKLPETFSDKTDKYSSGKPYDLKTYKIRNKTDYAQVVMAPNDKGEMLVSSPINRTGWNYHVVNINQYDKNFLAIEGQEEKLDNIEINRYISQQVRDSVWRRAQGKCENCGSKINLEFDHIIPISKGGSNTYRNIQLLCEKCNRVKSDKIG